MDEQAISVAADIAAVYLVVLMFLTTLITAVGLGIVWWYLRRGRKALVLPFLYAQVFALRVQNATMKVSDKIAGVPIALHSNAERVKVTTQTLLRGTNRPEN